MLDTSVAIHLRDRDPDILNKVTALNDRVVLSIITLVELEGGVYAKPALTAIRRSRLDVMLSVLGVIEFDQAAAAAYRSIVEQAGFSRRKMADRMIAATALVHQAQLATMNADDFKDVPGLSLVAW